MGLENLYPTIDQLSLNNVYEGYSSEGTLNDNVKGLLNHSEFYAKKVLGRTTNEQDEFQYTVKNRDSDSSFNFSFTSINIGNSSSRTYSHDTRTREEKKEDNDVLIRCIVGIGAVIAAAVGTYLLAKSDEKIEETKEQSRWMVDAYNEQMFSSVEPDSTTKAVRTLAMVHVRMLDREMEDANSLRIKAICMIAGAAIMGVGAIFGLMPVMIIGGVALTALGLKSLYDYVRDVNGKANKKDARWMLDTINTLKMDAEKRAEQLQNAYNYNSFNVSWTAQNYMEFPVPSAPSYEEVMSN